MNLLLEEDKFKARYTRGAENVMGLELIERELYHALSDSKGTVREMCTHILGAGGKRVRPMLVMYSGLIFSRLKRELVEAAIASELIHMASLIHDDIIDNSNLRRSKPSINKLWGSHFAVLCGDYLFARAFGIMSGNRLLSSLDLMVEAIENMCQGEILQAGDRFNTEVDEDAYYDRIAKKTAIFLKNCCRSGAVVSEADDSQVEALGEYGLNIGYAYQITDDILDFYGKVDEMGKPKNEDLRQGIITLPVILLMKNHEYGPWVKEKIQEKELSEETLNQVNQLLKSTGILEECYNTAEAHVQTAIKCLEMLPQSKYTKALYDISCTLKTRTN